ncbi:zinc finger protein 691-like isoform X1 [Lineus longissimus]|uniref:zinc finger protein 691-like isoform X1 n=1 Tax=Lineus longissimus TaxID=88925 RepID=UPI00315D0DE5
MERRKRSANQEPVIVLDEEEKMEPIHKLLKLDRDKVKTIQSEMRTKGLVLSQTWSDLYSLMSRYQAELITREDQLIDIESQLDAQRNIARDNELERMKLQMQAKDREIKTIHMDMLNKSELLVKTQNELGRVKCLLRSKDDLIRKLQCEVKVEEDSVMAGDSPAEQVSTKTATSATSSSGTGTDTSSLIIEQTHLEEHVQTNFSRSGSDDSGTGAEKTDAKYQVSSSNDEETDSFLPLESDVATINIPGQDSGVLEEVQPGTSATDDTGQWTQVQDKAQLLVVEAVNPANYLSSKTDTDVSFEQSPPHQSGQTFHSTTSESKDASLLPSRRRGRLLRHRKSSEMTCRVSQPGHLSLTNPSPRSTQITDINSEGGCVEEEQDAWIKRMRGASTSQPVHSSFSDISLSMPGVDIKTETGQPTDHDTTFEKQSFQCPTCGKIFPKRQKLINHSYTHTGEKPFRCSECFKQFNDRSNLKRHARLHSGVKAYCCEICGKTFAQISNLKTHRLIHRLYTKPE